VPKIRRIATKFSSTPLWTFVANLKQTGIVLVGGHMLVALCS